MPSPDIRFNNLTGSDSRASGAGPETAIWGTDAAHTSGVSSSTVQLTNSPNLSTVVQDGSAVLWMNLTSGRRFFAILGVDNVAKTITIDGTVSIGTGGGLDRSYAIGGKRSDLSVAQSASLFDSTNGASKGWKITLEQTNVAYKITAGLSITSTGIVIRGTGGVVEIQKDYLATTAVLTVSGLGNVFSSLRFNRVQPSTTMQGAVVSCATANCLFHNCIFETTVQTTATTLNYGLIFSSSIAYAVYCINCTFRGNSWGVFKSSGTSTAHFVFTNCLFVDNVEGGLSTNNSWWILLGCIFARSKRGIVVSGSAAKSLFVQNCTVDNNLEGMNLSASVRQDGLAILNCSITKNGNFGLTLPNIDPYSSAVGYNNFGTGQEANLLGSIDGTLHYGIGTDLFADPQYTDRAVLNYQPLSSSPIAAQGMPVQATETIGVSATKSNVSMGASQASASSAEPNVVSNVGSTPFSRVLIG